MVKKFAIFWASGFGSGYAPIASGTFGTAVAIPLYYLIHGLTQVYYLIFLAGFTAFAIWCASIAEVHYGKKDPGEVVIDEIAGYFTTMFLIPISWQSVIVGFFVFRFFDIVKPPPVRAIDRNMPGGAGIVLDDVAAGIYSWLVMLILLKLGLLQ